MFARKKSLSGIKGSIPRDELRRRSRILVIDDERPELVDELTAAGLAVDYRSDVDATTLGVLDQTLYDLLILDFGNVGTKLGHEQGLTVLRHVKRVNPSMVVLAYTSKAIGSEFADFFRLADGILAKDAGIADSLERIEQGLQKAHSIENVWRGLLALGGVQPGTSQDAEWQDMAVRAIEKPKKLSGFKQRVLENLKEESAKRVATVLIEKLVELGVKAAMGA